MCIWVLTLEKVQVDVVPSKELCDEAIRGGAKRLLLDCGTIDYKNFSECSNCEIVMKWVRKNIYEADEDMVSDYESS